jgi:hypothetical protein
MSNTEDDMADIERLLQERGKTHGQYSDHARITQRTKSLWREHPGWAGLTFSQRETLDMIAHKVGRILSGNPNHQDHWDDIAGYSTLVSKEIHRHAARPAGTSRDGPNE